MMQIYLSDSNYRYTGDMCSSINSVLQNHPLGTDILTPEVLNDLIVKVHLESRADITIDCEQCPLIKLCLDPAKYEKDHSFNDELFEIDLYHEFTHLIDRLNPVFGLGLSVAPQPNVKIVWNVYIDGRLWRRDIKVKSFDDYKQILFGTRLQMGYDCSKAISKSKIAWDAENLTYKSISKLTKGVTQLAVNSPKTNDDGR